MTLAYLLEEVFWKCPRQGNPGREKLGEMGGERDACLDWPRIIKHPKVYQTSLAEEVLISHSIVLVMALCIGQSLLFCPVCLPVLSCRFLVDGVYFSITFLNLSVLISPFLIASLSPDPPLSLFSFLQLIFFKMSDSRIFFLYIFLDSWSLDFSTCSYVVLSLYLPQFFCLS